VRKLKVVLSILSGIAVAGHGSAQSTGTPPGPPTPEVQSPVEITGQRLCAAEPVIGTRLAVRRKCATPAQKQEMQQQARETIDTYRRKPCMAGTETMNNEPMRC
jgi:hypothetical protein